MKLDIIYNSTLIVSLDEFTLHNQYTENRYAPTQIFL